MKKAKIKPFLAQKKTIKKQQKQPKTALFLQIQSFYKFFTRDKPLTLSCINPYLYICRNIYNNNNNIIIQFSIYTF